MYWTKKAHISVVDGVVVHRGVVVDLLGEPPEDDVTGRQPLGQERSVNAGLDGLVGVEDEHGHGHDQLVLREVVLLHLELELLGLTLGCYSNFPESNLKRSMLWVKPFFGGKLKSFSF